jgi:hypothetical protein
VIVTKKKRKKLSRSARLFSEIRLKRLAELQAEAEFSSQFEAVEGKFFHARHLERVMREWQERRIIN